MPPTKLSESVKSTFDPLGKVLFGNGNVPEVKETTPAAIAGSIVAYLFAFLGVIFLVLAVYGGILWMTAAGNEEKATKGRTVITQAVVGLLVTLAVGSIYVTVRWLIGGIAVT